MSFKGMLLKAGITTDGKNVIIEEGTLTANNIMSPPGTTYYVDASVTASGSGQSWDEAYKTVLEAITAAGDYATIYVNKGTYDAGVVLNITQTGLRLIGLNTTADAWGGAVLRASSADHTIITVNASDVEIAYLTFVQSNAASINIDVSPATTDAYRTHIHHCSFGEGGFGVRSGLGAAADAPDTVVEDCVFLTTDIAIDLYSTFSTIRRNHIKVYSGGVGIQIEQNGSDRGWLSIMDNSIIGFNSTDTGIKFSNTPTESRIIMAGNRVVNCATPITAQRYTSWYDGNYFGVDDGKYHSSIDFRGGRNFYVDANAGTTGLDGRSFASAFLTITEALAAISTYDTINVLAGSYTEADVLDITNAGTRIIGVTTAKYQWGLSGIFTNTAAGHLMTINANNVEIAHLNFVIETNNKDAIRTASTAETVWNLHIHDCHFAGNPGEYGINMNLTNDTVECVIERCEFLDFATAGVLMYGSRSKIMDCLFFTSASCSGLIYYANADDRGYCLIADNKLVGSASSDSGIVLPSTPSAGKLLVYNNCVTNHATINITQDKTKENFANNPTYLNGTGTGQVDIYSS